MKTAIVSLADIAAEPGHPLDACFWCNRLPGERYDEFQLREQIERRIKVIVRQQARLARQIREFAALRRQHRAS